MAKKPLIRLKESTISEFIDHIEEYGSEANAASSSQMDPNANVKVKSISTLEEELKKQINIQINREKVKRKLHDLYGRRVASEYIRQIEEHEIYIHDESSLKPYCVSITMYPFLEKGTIPLGGNAYGPKHLSSFVGAYSDLVYEIAAYFAGAVATVEFFVMFDYFARKDYGDNYLREQKQVLEKLFSHVIYHINEPAATRGNQSVFLNWNLLDRKYLEAMFGNFVFPDGGKPNLESTFDLQFYFLDWFTEENKKRMLPFPVLTGSCIYTKKDGWGDEEFINKICEAQSRGARLFLYNSETVDSLASCCRLKNIIDVNDFTYSLGAGGVRTGSKNVITLNLMRLFAGGNPYSLAEQIDLIHKYQVAHNSILTEYYSAGLLKPYNENYISLNDQYLTIGISGAYEAAKLLGYSSVEERSSFLASVFNNISILNAKAKEETGLKFNTEMVPGESLGVKFAQWDKRDGYNQISDIYNSYFFPVEEDIPLREKIRSHSSRVSGYLDGGSALHLNLDHLLSRFGFKTLYTECAEQGVPYIGVNVKITGCKDCGFLSPNTHKVCPECGSHNIKYATRIIGYCSWIENWSNERQEEAEKRFYHRGV